LIDDYKKLENNKTKSDCISSWHITVCIAEVRVFDAGSAGTTAKLKNKRTKNEQMLTDVRLPGQLIVSDQMLIASPSSPYFGNTFVICPACRLDCFSISFTLE